MSDPIPTIGGVATTGEAFSKLLHHIDEARSLCAVLSHLHNTEDTPLDKLKARSWLEIENLLHRTRHSIVHFAKGSLQ